MEKPLIMPQRKPSGVAAHGGALSRNGIIRLIYLYPGIELSP